MHRILPGLWFALLLTALLIAPVTAWVAGEHYHLSFGLAYALLNSFTLYLANGIPGTLQSAPIDAWNGSLGTLQFEMTMYLLVGLLLGSVHVRRFPRAVAAGTLIVMTGIQLGLAWQDVRGGLLMDFTHFGSFFAAGVFLRSQGTRARVSGPLVVTGVLVLLGLCLFDLAGLLGALPIAYLVLALGAALPIRWGAVNDYSYGTYIFAFPVQQVLTAVGVPSWGVLAYIMVSAAATAPLAIASWWLVERPALGLLKRSLAAATQPTAPRSSTLSTAKVALSHERGS